MYQVDPYKVNVLEVAPPDTVDVLLSVETVYFQIDLTRPHRCISQLILPPRTPLFPRVSRCSTPTGTLVSTQPPRDEHFPYAFSKDRWGRSPTTTQLRHVWIPPSLFVRSVGSGSGSVGDRATCENSITVIIARDPKSSVVNKSRLSHKVSRFDDLSC